MAKRIIANEHTLEQPNAAKVEKGIEQVLDGLLFDWKKDPNMQETPKRVAKMYTQELFKGCYTQRPKFTTFPNTKNVDEMVLVSNIRIQSTCSHHLMPFQGYCHIAYLPSPEGRICGLSKLARVAEWYARRPQIQEELTNQIAEFLNKELDPLGVMVVIKAQHGCMTNRGVMQPNSWAVTSKVTGSFKTKPEARAEFFSLIGGTNA